MECPPRTKPVADSTPLADSGGEVGGSAADSTADLNPAESAGLQSPLGVRGGVRGGVRRLPTESMLTSNPRLNLSRDIQHSILLYCGQMKRSLVINLNHYPHNVNSVQL